MKSYGTDPVDAGKAKDIATGKELLEKVVENLIKAGKIGDEMHLLFINDRLRKGRADFFDPIKRVNLDIGLKKTKKDSESSFSHEVFGVMLGEKWT